MDEDADIREFCTVYFLNQWGFLCSLFLGDRHSSDLLYGFSFVVFFKKKLFEALGKNSLPLPTRWD